MESKAAIGHFRIKAVTGPVRHALPEDVLLLLRIRMARKPVKIDKAIAKFDRASVNIGKGPAKIDSPPANNDRAPENLDEAPANLDAAPAKIDSAPVNIDRAPVNVDAAPANLDAAPAKIDSAPVNIDNAPVNVDSAPANLDKAPANLDGSPANLDGAPAKISVTTAIPARTPATCYFSMSKNSAPQGRLKRKSFLYMKGFSRRLVPPYFHILITVKNCKAGRSASGLFAKHDMESGIITANQE